ncbi:MULTISPECIES: pore-forming ESAT-6 family protein [Thermomonosporaceae]|uniref:pore-forming ESAT-6 family protein n=1 Tax=Thermomonosporaceae TaxID=2012 RepID=UPI00255A7DFC|nr:MULTISPECIES: pore-forming ESAT-6 family protein [Thermomonosporaceae]MDL4772397.1 pore-forming ESAT-6 family protein [Actinomadura xylanilytica]
MGTGGRRSYDTGASQEAQTNIHAVIARLEALIGQHESDVKAALSDFEATGVSPEYAAKEARWNKAANETREIIRLLKATLASNDQTAQTALGKASAAVAAI